MDTSNDKLRELYTRYFRIYPELITRGFKNEGRKLTNVAVLDSSIPRIFVRKGKERKVIKKRIKTSEGVELHNY